MAETGLVLVQRWVGENQITKRKKRMNSFLVKLCSVIHWIGFLMTCWLIYVVLSVSDLDTELSLINLTVLIPNTIGWLIKLIFTGNRRFFPF